MKSNKDVRQDMGLMCIRNDLRKMKMIIWIIWSKEQGVLVRRDMEVTELAVHAMVRALVWLSQIATHYNQ